MKRNPTSMNPRQIELIETSFKAFVPVAYPTAELFYAKLFQISPPPARDVSKRYARAARQTG